MTAKKKTTKKAPTEKKKIGRPTTYKPEYAKDIGHYKSRMKER